MSVSTDWATTPSESTDWNGSSYIPLLGVTMGDTRYTMGDSVATMGDTQINPAIGSPSTNWADA